MVTNDSTSAVYAFISATYPTLDGSPIYEADELGSGWTVVSSSGGHIVYAYGGAEGMTEIDMDGETAPLMSKLTMKQMSNAEYVFIGDYGFDMVGYIVGTGECGSSVSEAWARAVELGRIKHFFSTLAKQSTSSNNSKYFLSPE